MNERDIFEILRENNVVKHTDQIGSLLYGSEEIGIRKIRLAKNHGKGKREGYRLIVLVLKYKNNAYMIHIYDKKKKSNLTDDEKKGLKEILKSTPK